MKSIWIYFLLGLTSAMILPLESSSFFPNDGNPNPSASLLEDDEEAFNFFPFEGLDEPRVKASYPTAYKDPFSLENKDTNMDWNKVLGIHPPESQPPPPLEPPLQTDPYPLSPLATRNEFMGRIVDSGPDPYDYPWFESFYPRRFENENDSFRGPGKEDGQNRITTTTTTTTTVRSRTGSAGEEEDDVFVSIMTYALGLQQLLICLVAGFILGCFVTKCLSKRKRCGCCGFDAAAVHNGNGNVAQGPPPPPPQVGGMMPNQNSMEGLEPRPDSGRSGGSGGGRSGSGGGAIVPFIPPDVGIIQPHPQIGPTPRNGVTTNVNEIAALTNHVATLHHYGTGRTGGQGQGQCQGRHSSLISASRPRNSYLNYPQVVEPSRYGHARFGNQNQNQHHVIDLATGRVHPIDGRDRDAILRGGRSLLNRRGARP